MDNKPASGKRAKISRAQQYTMLEVLGASLVLGACVVLAIFMIKYIKFNTQIIAAKNDAITDYDKTIRNVGICVDTDGNKRLSDKELEGCNPNAVKLEQVVGSLRYNVLSQMAQNEDLESVARQRVEDCYSADGEKIDFDKLYEQSTDEKEKQQYLQLSKICSALRVVPDALPAQKNTEALMASLDQLFILTGWEPERLSPRDDVVASPIKGVETIPVTLRVEGGDQVIMNVLGNIERSIREFSITTATVEWTSTGVSLQAAANAYYLAPQEAVETEKVLYATPKARTARKNKSKVQSANDSYKEATE